MGFNSLYQNIDETSDWSAQNQQTTMEWNLIR